MKRVLKFITTRIEDIICIFFFALMNVSLLLQVSTRLMGFPLSWTEEVSRFSYIWITFIGMAFAKKLDLNIRITFIVEPLGKTAKKILQVLLELLEFAAHAFLLYWSIQFCKFSKVNLMPTLEWTMLIVYLSIPIGIGLTMIRSIQGMVVLLKPSKAA
jgi:TRAP-type C4-dicarboxylate transport system permease small subunit